MKNEEMKKEVLKVIENIEDKNIIEFLYGYCVLGCSNRTSSKNAALTDQSNSCI